VSSLPGAVGATMEDLLIFEENYDEDFRFGFSYSM
jgi:hypothetical protein